MKPRFLEAFPEYCSLLLSGPPGVGKLDYMLAALGTYLEEGHKVLFVCVDVSPREVLNYAAQGGTDVQRHLGKSLLFVDCFSPSISEEVDERKGVILVSSFSNLEGIGMALTKACQQLGLPAKILFYTISTLFLHNSPQALSKFYQIISSRVRTQIGLILYGSHEGVNEERQEKLLMSLVDGLMEMRFNDSMGREIRLHHLRGARVKAEWSPVTDGQESQEKAAAGGGIWTVGEGGGNG